MAGLFGNPFAVTDPRKRDMGNIAWGAPQQSPAPQEAPTRGGFGTKRAIGILGDALLGLGGHQGVYAPMRQHEKMLAERQRIAEEQRQWEMEDWQRKQQWQRQNPDPIIRENNMGDVVQIDAATGQATTIYEDPYQKTVVGPDGRFYPLQMQPRRPVGKLTPIEPTQQMAAQPQSGGPFMTRDQFRRLVAERGDADAAAFVMQNNIQVRD